MNLKKEADLIEEQGRYGDTELVHLNPIEVKWLEKMTPGGKLTRNPVTGKKEAWVQYVIMAVSAIANIASGKKRQKEAEKAAQEGAYIEGSAPIIPASNQLELETIGEAAPEAGGLAPDFREALQDSYGGGMYDSPQFQGEQIPPELMELLQQQQMSGQEPTNVQLASSGGPVGLPEDVYNFPVEKISQMQMDVDPGVRNVGNAMMAQMEANPGMGMVGASAADIDQMAAGGPVQPRRYDDGGVIQEAIVNTVTDQIPGVSQAKILRAIEMTDDPEEKRRLARQLIPGYGLGEMGAQGVKALGRKIKERPRMRAWRARRRGEGIPEFGPR